MSLLGDVEMVFVVVTVLWLTSRGRMCVSWSWLTSTSLIEVS